MGQSTSVANSVQFTTSVPSSPVTCVVNSGYVNQSTVSIPLSPIVTQSTSVANSVFVTQSAASVAVFGCGTVYKCCQLSIVCY